MPTIEIHSDITSIDAHAWDALVDDHNPFITHAFLALLESSVSVGGKTGWIPRHITLRDDDERTIGAVPAYVKLHSYGEYIFDWSWADAAMRAGVEYYPKLTAAVPHTPATGPRLLIAPDVPRRETQELLAQALLQVGHELGCSSTHLLFTLDDEASSLEAAGFHRRATHQFHFRNPGYGSFDDFLGTMRSDVRKQIKRERRRVADSGLTIALVRGDEATDDEWRTMDRLYRSTSGRKWGSPYLTEAFFRDAKRTIGESALLCFARRDDEIVAGTLSFEKGKHLYGRYWGATVDEEFLHFELCYYQLIDHAIKSGLSLVEAGAQGEHKIKRGFLPVVTHSAHRFYEPALDDAIARFLQKERRSVENEILAFEGSGPFKEGAVDFGPRTAGLLTPLVDDERTGSE